MDCIRVKELSKRYRAVTALHGVSFEISGGGPVALVGKNGAGKTTLLAVLCGILNPSSGTVEIFGLPHAHPGLLGRIGALMQDASFRHGISGIDQVTHLAQLAGATRNTAMAAATELLRELGDDDFARLNP
ncbi:MAG: ATP-binding cassette domain-containing protein, partial [Gammaproteobacteria bacterium]